MGAQGSASLDFGAFPGSQEVALDVASVGLVTGSLLEAWVLPKATADHSADEHRHEELAVSSLYKADGTLTIYGRCTANGPRDANGRKLYGVFNVGWVWN